MTMEDLDYIYSDLEPKELESERVLRESNEALKAENKELREELEVLNSRHESRLRENQILARNLSSLIKTARLEVNRKNSKIDELKKKLDDIIFRKGGNLESGKELSSDLDPRDSLSFLGKLKIPPKFKPYVKGDLDKDCCPEVRDMFVDAGRGIHGISCGNSSLSFIRHSSPPGSSPRKSVVYIKLDDGTFAGKKSIPESGPKKKMYVMSPQEFADFRNTRKREAQSSSSSPRPSKRHRGSRGPSPADGKRSSKKDHFHDRHSKSNLDRTRSDRETTQNSASSREERKQKYSDRSHLEKDVLRKEYKRDGHLKYESSMDRNTKESFRRERNFNEHSKNGTLCERRMKENTRSNSKPSSDKRIDHGSSKEQKSDIRFKGENSFKKRTEEVSVKERSGENRFKGELASDKDGKEFLHENPDRVSHLKNDLNEKTLSVEAKAEGYVKNRPSMKTSTGEKTLNCQSANSYSKSVKGSSEDSHRSNKLECHFKSEMSPKKSNEGNPWINNPSETQLSHEKVQNKYQLKLNTNKAESVLKNSYSSSNHQNTYFKGSGSSKNPCSDFSSLKETGTLQNLDQKNSSNKNLESGPSKEEAQNCSKLIKMSHEEIVKSGCRTKGFSDEKVVNKDCKLEEKSANIKDKECNPLKMPSKTEDCDEAKDKDFLNQESQKSPINVLLGPNSTSSFELSAPELIKDTVIDDSIDHLEPFQNIPEGQTELTSCNIFNKKTKSDNVNYHCESLNARSSILKQCERRAHSNESFKGENSLDIKKVGNCDASEVGMKDRGNHKLPSSTRKPCNNGSNAFAELLGNCTNVHSPIKKKLNEGAFPIGPYEWGSKDNKEASSLNPESPKNESLISNIEIKYKFGIETPECSPRKQLLKVSECFSKMDKIVLEASKKCELKKRRAVFNRELEDQDVLSNSRLKNKNLPESSCKLNSKDSIINGKNFKRDISQEDSELHVSENKQERLTRKRRSPLRYEGKENCVKRDTNIMDNACSLREKESLRLTNISKTSDTVSSGGHVDWVENESQNLSYPFVHNQSCSSSTSNSESKSDSKSSSYSKIMEDLFGSECSSEESVSSPLKKNVSPKTFLKTADNIPHSAIKKPEKQSTVVENTKTNIKGYRIPKKKEEDVKCSKIVSKKISDNVSDKIHHNNIEEDCRVHKMNLNKISPSLPRNEKEGTKAVSNRKISRNDSKRLEAFNLSDMGVNELESLLAFKQQQMRELAEKEKLTKSSQEKALDMEAPKEPGEISEDDEDVDQTKKGSISVFSTPIRNRTPYETFTPKSGSVDFNSTAGIATILRDDLVRTAYVSPGSGIISTPPSGALNDDSSSRRRNGMIIDDSTPLRRKSPRKVGSRRSSLIYGRKSAKKNEVPNPMNYLDCSSKTSRFLFGDDSSKK